MTEFTEFQIDLPAELKAWISDYASHRDLTVDEVTESLFQALRDNRLSVKPRTGPHPYLHDPLFPTPPTTE